MSLQHDQTEQNRLEALLREAEQRQRQVLDAIPDLILCKGLKSRIVWANAALRGYFGMTLEQLQVLIDSPIDPADPVQRYLKADHNIFTDACTLDIAEEAILRHDGVERIFHTVKSPIRNISGEVVMTVGISHDITEHKQAEQEMLAAWTVAEEAHTEIEEINQELEQAIFKTNNLAVAAEYDSHAKSVIISGIPSILIGLDEEEHITEWNPAAEHAFGIGALEVIGKPFSSCAIQWDWSQMQACLQAQRQDGSRQFLEEFRYTRPEDGERVLGITLTPVLDAVGGWAGGLLLAADITERKRMEAQLAHAQKMESIGQLAAGIAHEINTPIQYIGDNTRFIQESFDQLRTLLTQYDTLLSACKQGRITPQLIAEIEATAEAADVAYLIEEIPTAIGQSLEGIGHVAHIVQAMKEFSHPGTREKTAIDLNHAIESTVTVARSEWKYVAELVTDFDPQLPLVTCLPGDFNQVILNIIVNAAHAINNVVEQTPGTKGTITISTHREPAWAVIKIQDTGGGIPEAIRSKIFDPFFTTKEVGKGTGQGLAIAHSIIVGKHAGAIDLESIPGDGTTFIIRLPLSPDEC